jgi:N-acetylglucosamine-6-sulfatase
MLALAALATLAAGAGLGDARPPARAATKPNIVFILTDDLSSDLLRFMPHVAALQARGETFDHYFVADSLCCPSRASIFTGRFPHNTHVLSNTPPLGGYWKFKRRGLERKTFAVAVHRRGYATSLLGKYLNGYGDPVLTGRNARTPPGWTDWHVANRTGYREFDYELDDNGHVDAYASDYGVDRLADSATAFIARERSQPFLLEIATFAPHEPYTPAARNAQDFPGLHAPRDPSFDAPNTDPPRWLARLGPLTADQLARIDLDYRKRAQSVEAIDALLARVEAQLVAQHELANTYIVFSSDNGYHLGQHELSVGKMTAFDSDVRVPLIVAGPGVPSGAVVHQIAQNVDLYPTFVALAGGVPSPSVDGHSLVPLLHPHGRTRWRTAALLEHRGRTLRPGDPDYADSAHGDPTTYEAIRVSRPGLEAVYVRYPDGEREFYDLTRDPYERHNRARALSARQRAQLDRTVKRLARCHGARACWRAGRTPRALRSRA